MRTLYTYKIWTVKAQFSPRVVVDDPEKVFQNKPSMAYLETNYIKPCLYDDYIDDLLFEAIDKKRVEGPGTEIEAENVDQAIELYFKKIPLNAGERVVFAVYDVDHGEYKGAAIVKFGEKLTKAALKDATRGIGATERYKNALKAVIHQREVDEQLLKKAASSMDVGAFMLDLALFVAQNGYMNENTANGKLLPHHEIKLKFSKFVDAVEAKAREIGAAAPFARGLIGAKRRPYEDDEADFIIYKKLKPALQKAESATE